MREGFNSRKPPARAKRGIDEPERAKADIVMGVGNIDRRLGPERGKSADENLGLGKPAFDQQAARRTDKVKRGVRH